MRRAVVFLIGLFFFLRPHLMTMRANPNSGGANYVEQVQRFQHMASRPDQVVLRERDALVVVVPRLGHLALALIGACWLAWEQIAGRRRVWAPAFLVSSASAAWVLFAPSITPDHPWADRRFVPVVLPGLVLFAAACDRRRQCTARRSSLRGRADWRAVGAAGALQGAVARSAALIVVPVWTGSRDVLYTKTEVGEPAWCTRCARSCGPATLSSPSVAGPGRSGRER